MMTQADRLPRGQRRGAQALDLIAADYREVFRTAAGRRVLADLANYSGFYSVCDVTVSSDALRVVEGQRRLFNRILRFVSATAEEMAAIEEAARRERITTNDEGDYL